MSQALEIFAHALAMIFRNIGATLGVLWPGLVMIVGATVMIGQIPAGMMGPLLGQPTTGAETVFANPLLLLIGLLVLLLGFVLMAVLWHRYVLLPDAERQTGLTPPASVIGRYLWCSLLLGVILIAVSFVVFIPVGIFSTLGGAGAIAVLLFTLPATLLIGWVALRLSLILPAAALGQTMRIRESWEATRPAAHTIVWLAFGLALLNLILSTGLGALAGRALPLIWGMQMLGSVITALIGASVLTTLYGILVEGRKLG